MQELIFKIKTKNNSWLFNPARLILISEETNKTISLAKKPSILLYVVCHKTLFLNDQQLHKDKLFLEIYKKNKTLDIHQSIDRLMRAINEATKDIIISRAGKRLIQIRGELSLWSTINC